MKATYDEIGARYDEIMADLWTPGRAFTKADTDALNAIVVEEIGKMGWSMAEFENEIMIRVS